MRDNKITLSEAIKFHGHLGPYLVLGLLAGEVALKKLRCNKYFGLRVEVRGALKKPKSCFIDGLQLSTGVTYGKGNIYKLGGRKIQANFQHLKDKKNLRITFKKDLSEVLGNLISHSESEALARVLYKTDPAKLFHFIPKN